MRQKRQLITGKLPKRRSPDALMMILPQFQTRKVQPKTGRGSYSRKRLSSPTTQA
jgi:hypothetical protein